MVWIEFTEGQAYYYYPAPQSFFDVINTQVGTSKAFNAHLRRVERPPATYEQIFGFYGPNEYTHFVDVLAPIT